MSAKQEPGVKYFAGSAMQDINEFKGTRFIFQPFELYECSFDFNGNLHSVFDERGNLIWHW